MTTTSTRTLGAAFLATAFATTLVVPFPIGPTHARAESAVAPAETTTSAPVAVGDLVIRDAWTRQSPPGARAGGGYATITNNGGAADRLIGGSTPFSERFEVHEMSVTDGVMRMGEIDGGLEIGPGETVELKPGGFHLMFIDVTEPPVEGDTVPVTLLFERAGEVTLDLPVAAIGATAPDGPAMKGGTDHGGHGAMGDGSPSTDDAATTN